MDVFPMTHHVECVALLQKCRRAAAERFAMNWLTSAFSPYGALRAHFALTRCVPIARMSCVVTVRAMAYPSDLTDEQ